MSGPTVIIPKHGKLGEGFSKQEKLLAMKHPGRQTNPQKGYQSRAAWIADLVALRKVIILCSFCRSYFNPRKANYRRVYVPDITGKTDGYTVNGDCDVCKGFTPNLGGGTAFTPDELYVQTHMDPAEARRARRARMGDEGIWKRIERESHNYPKVHRPKPSEHDSQKLTQNERPVVVINS